MSLDVLTRRQMENAVRQMDPSVDGRAVKAATVLLAALQEGTSPDRLVAFTGYSRKTVVEFVVNLRTGGVFTDDGHITGGAWFEEGGGVAFWLDVSVALGYVKKGAA